jgi:hypothetical protein
MFSGQHPGDVAVSADEVSVVLPSKKTEQVSARISGENSERLAHLIELLKAFSRAQKEGRDVEKRITPSFALREVISVGLDVMLGRFNGYPKTAEGRAAQLDEVESGKLRPSSAADSGETH